MRRDRTLEEKIALALEDDPEHSVPIEIPGHTQEEIGYHMWLMIGDGFLTGVDVTSHGDRCKQGLASGLTSKGHDLAEHARARETPNVPSIPVVRLEKPMPPAGRNNPRLFISHSSEDKEYAELLTELLRASLGLRPVEIRCTSVDGYRLKGGADTDVEIKRELLACEVFIGLLSDRSLRSLYVLFELGARWGTDRHFLPLLTPGTLKSLLDGPLGGLNALEGDNRSQLHQAIDELAEAIGVTPNPPATYQKQMEAVLEFAKAPKPSGGGGGGGGGAGTTGSGPAKPALRVIPGFSDKNTDWMGG